MNSDEEPDERSEQRPKKQTKKSKFKKRRSSLAFMSALGSFLSANQAFLLTRVLPVLVVIIGVPLMVGLIAYRSMVSSKTEKLAEKLGQETRGIAMEPAPKPYVRGNLVILETHGHVDYLLNSHVKPPLDDPQSIGSVILVEWKLRVEAARNSSGQAMRMSGFKDDEAVAHNKWSCRVKLVDLKRRVVIYEAGMAAPNRTFNEGEKVLLTPTSSVSKEELAGEFDKIRNFPKITLNADPP